MILGVWISTEGTRPRTSTIPHDCVIRPFCFNQILNPKDQVLKRKTERMRTFMEAGCDCNCSELQEADEADEHELSEAAQLTAAALFSLVCKEKSDGED